MPWIEFHNEKLMLEAVPTMDLRLNAIIGPWLDSN